ncbi:MAG: DUF2723 domain-containing protein [Bacteroidota bacterium]
MRYERINDISGWVIFAIAFVSYLLTMAPTASFWDCGEFIACSNELEVPHPPGAPFFLLIGRVFALFSFGDVTKVALMLNIQSVLSASFTVLFTFWITTILSKKLLVKRDETPSQEQTIAIMLAGAVGALACTYADSFWFNAVEAEVYAMSSFFTAVVVWLMFKWEARADQPGHLRWILLIAYLMGLSIGVHLLNLLTIPALAFIYYFRKHDFSWGGFIGTGLVSVAILGVIQSGIILYTFDLAWAFERFFSGVFSARGVQTSGMSLPIGTGLVLFCILLFGTIAGLLYYSSRKNMVWLNTFVLGILVVYLGFSSYLMIPIRSNANPPIDENNPENTLTFLSYMKREQYGDRPLFRGPLYNSRPTGYDKSTEYVLKKVKVEGGTEERYVAYGEKLKPKYAPRDKKFFPRMYESSRYNMGPHAYTAYVRNTGDPKDPYDDKPTPAEDFKYFVNYQIIHMYWRYFMWNFAGRESDIQDTGWESGIAFWKTSNMPESVRDNPAKNHFFMLPFLLGLVGLAWQIKRRGEDAAVVGLLFFFTGFAIILYLNQYPMQPRERDYSFAGSFQTYAIWIGLSVIAMYEFLRKFLKGGAVYVAGGLALLAPILMAAQGWDDHSRAGRYIAPDSAYNLLNSLDQNAVLFTNGDNDTFPLWYIQEVENIRPDVRVLCLSYVNTDWYVQQMYQQMNESTPLPLSLKEDEYTGQQNQAKYFPGTKKNLQLKLPVSAQNMMDKGIISERELPYVKSIMEWTIPTRAGGGNRYLELKDWVIINLITNVAKEGWDRPVYFANTVAPSSFLGLEPNLRLEGLAYRIMPFRMPQERDPYDPYKSFVDPVRMYDNLIGKFRYRNLANKGVYYDDNINRMVSNYHGVFYRLANFYLREADKLERQLQVVGDSIALPTELAEAKPEDLRKKAEEVMMYADENFPYDVAMPEPYVLVRSGILFDRMGLKEKAEEYFSFARKVSSEHLNYYADQGKYFGKKDSYMAALQMLGQHYQFSNQAQQAQELNQEVQNLTAKFRRNER